MRWWARVLTFVFALGLAFLFGVGGSQVNAALGFAAAFGMFAVLAYDAAYRYPRSGVVHPFRAIWRSVGGVRVRSRRD